MTESCVESLYVQSILFQVYKKILPFVGFQQVRGIFLLRLVLSLWERLWGKVFSLPPRFVAQRQQVAVAKIFSRHP